MKSTAPAEEAIVVPQQFWLIVAFLLGGGAFSLMGGLMDWDFFISNRRARLPLAKFGRKGARIFYGIIGVLLMLGGTGMLLLAPELLSTPIP